MAAKKKPANPQPPEAIAAAGQTRKPSATPADPLLAQALEALQEVARAPTLAIPGWQSRRRRAGRAKPNIVTDAIEAILASCSAVTTSVETDSVEPAAQGT